MAEPPLARWRILCAFLGDKFEALSKAGRSYKVQARDYGFTHPNLVKLANGRTVGGEVMFAIADALEHGSVDALVAASKSWWSQLDEAAREERLADWRKADAKKRARRSNTTTSERVGFAHEAASAAKKRHGGAAVGKPAAGSVDRRGSSPGVGHTRKD